MIYTIKNDVLSVSVDDYGAEIKSVKIRGKEMIWQNPTGEWSSTSPVLFPVCGCCEITHKGVEYPVKFHGVARRADFTLTDSGADFLRFTLQSSEETKLYYPFDFTFELIYRIAENTLFVEHHIQNDGNEPMYYAAGGHESYNLDADVSEYVIEFDEEEEVSHSLAGEGSRLSGEKVSLGKTKYLSLASKYLDGSGTFVYEGLKSRKIWLCKKNGERLVELIIDKAFGNLLLWRAGNAKYICIEPWMNMPDTDSEKGLKIEFSQKRGVQKVNVGERTVLYRSIQYK